MTRLGFSIACALLLAAAGCEQCQQGETQQCSCNGSTGSQLCQPDHSYGSCVCGVDLFMQPRDMTVLDLTGSDSTSADMLFQRAPLVTGSATLYGVTTDDYVIYGTSNGLFAIPFGGGATQQLETAGTTVKTVIVSATAVLAFVNDGTKLDVWTSTNGVLPVSPVVDGLGGADSTGTLLWYRSTAAMDDQLVGATTADPSNATALYPWADVGRFGFAGARFLVSHVMDGTTTPATVTSFDASWNSIDLESMADPNDPFTANAATVAVLTVARDLEILPINGGPAVQVSSNVVGSGLLYSDSTAILYLLDQGVYQLMQSPIPSVAPTQLVSGVDFAFLSPDNQTVAFATVLAKMGAGSDLNTTPAAPPAKVTVIDAKTTNHFVNFTPDGKNVLYEASFNQGPMNGVLTAQPASGGQALSLGPAVGGRVFTLGGPRLLFGANDNGLLADVVFGDAVTGGAVTIEPQAAGFWPDQAGTRVVFATPPNGIWVVSLP